MNFTGQEIFTNLAVILGVVAGVELGVAFILRALQESTE